MRRDLLVAATSCGAADLSNVALLFYTQKDEVGGSGYEFLHKSFGEYLTARGLFDAFQRWGEQVTNPTSDFTEADFLRKWLKLTGPAPITREILTFMRNEARLMSLESDPEKPWKRARDLVTIAANLMNVAVRDGLPAHEGASRWRVAEIEQRNAEEALFGLVDSLSRAAYPAKLFSSNLAGGWESGPVRIAEFNSGDTFSRFLIRMRNVTSGAWMASPETFTRLGASHVELMLTRLALEDITFIGHSFARVSFHGTNFDRATFAGCSFHDVDFSCTTFRSANLDFVRLSNVPLSTIDFTDAIFSDCIYIDDHTSKNKRSNITRTFIARRVASERASSRRQNAMHDVNSLAKQTDD